MDVVPICYFQSMPSRIVTVHISLRYDRFARDPIPNRKLLMHGPRSDRNSPRMGNKSPHHSRHSPFLQTQTSQTSSSSRAHSPSARESARAPFASRLTVDARGRAGERVRPRSLSADRRREKISLLNDEDSDDNDTDVMAALRTETTVV